MLPSGSRKHPLGGSGNQAPGRAAIARIPSLHEQPRACAGDLGEGGTMTDRTPPSDARRPGETVPDRDARVEGVPAGRTESLHDDVLEREKSEFGGMKFGSAFFGWLTATGTAVLLTALVAAAGAAVGLGTSGGSADKAVDQANKNASTVGIVGAIALVVVLFVAYFCGGYVAGRMARFDGAKQ